MLSLLLDFIHVFPLEVNVGKSAADLLGQLDSFVFSIVLGALHTKASKYEALGVLLDLIWFQVDFKLELNIFK